MTLFANTVMLISTLGIRTFLVLHNKGESKQWRLGQGLRVSGFTSTQVTAGASDSFGTADKGGASAAMGAHDTFTMTSMNTSPQRGGPAGVAKRAEMVADVQLNEGGRTGVLERWEDCTMHMSANKPFVVLCRKRVCYMAFGIHVQCLTLTAIPDPGIHPPRPPHLHARNLRPHPPQDLHRLPLPQNLPP